MIVRMKLYGFSLQTVFNPVIPGADLGFSEGGAKSSSGSLKQEVW